MDDELPDWHRLATRINPSWVVPRRPTPTTSLKALRKAHRVVRLILLLLPAVGFAQRACYVAATGSDNADGRTPATAFRSLNRVNALRLQPGDSVLFRRGDTFRGTLQIRQSGAAGKPIVVDAYGSGPKPVLAGSAVVTGWTAAGGNVWQALCAACGSRVTGLYREGISLPLGRFPNADAPNRGYLTVQTHVGKTSLTSQQLLPADFTGGEAVMRKTQWILDRADVTTQSGNGLTLKGESNYDLGDGWGFFLQNHPATLDQPGEWCYDPARKILRLYNSGNPNARTVTATVFEKSLDLDEVSHVTVRNLCLTEALSVNLHGRGVSHLRLEANDVTNAGEDGLVLAGAGTEVVVENNHIAGVNNNGVVVDAYRNVTFRGNTVRGVGTAAGRGKSGDGHYNGLLLHSTDNTLVERNVIDSVGYNAVTFTDHARIQRNVISNYCLTKTDGGGIYAWNFLRRPMRDVHLVNNFIFNGIGAPEGTVRGDGYTGVNGIFLDECIENVEITGNAIFDNRGRGIFLHGDSRITVMGNTLFNNSDIQFAIKHNAGYCPVRENVVVDNTFVAKTASQLVANYDSHADDLAQFGTFDANRYVRPFEDAFKLRVVSNCNVVDNVTLAQWQARSGQDRRSTDSPFTYPPFRVVGLAPDARLSSTFDRSEDGWSAWSPYQNGEARRDASPTDGGSLRVNFPNPSAPGSDSYALVTHEAGTVAKSRGFLLQFDAVATQPKKIEVFLRQRNAPYRDLVPRAALLVGTTRQHFEVAFTAADDEAAALLAFSVREDGQSVWLDNVRLQEATLAPINPDDAMRFFFNPTEKDSLVTLDGSYRDAANRSYAGRVSLAPFSALVLLKDPASRISSDVLTATEPVTTAGANPVFPNPTSSRFSFLADDDVLALRLFNPLGRELLRVHGIRRNQRVEFGDSLLPGSYTVHIQYVRQPARSVKLLKSEF